MNGLWLRGVVTPLDSVEGYTNLSSERVIHGDEEGSDEADSLDLCLNITDGERKYGIYFKCF